MGGPRGGLRERDLLPCIALEYLRRARAVFFSLGVAPSDRAFREYGHGAISCPAFTMVPSFSAFSTVPARV